VTRQFLLLSVLRFAKLGLALVSLIVYGRVFGVGLQMDAWVFASGVVAAAGMLTWGPVNEIARSRFLQQVGRDGFEQAARDATRLLRVTALGAAALSLVLWGCGPRLVAWLYAGIDAQGAALMLQLFALLLPALVLGQMLALTSAYLNCCGVIYTPEWVGIAAGLFSLFFVVIGAAPWGVHALVAAHYAGLTISLTGSWWLLHRQGFLGACWRPLIGPGVRDYLHFATPLYLSYGAGQANAVLERSLATSLGPGSVSSLNYSAQIKSTLQAVITSVLFSLAVPRLTRAVVEQDGKAFWPAWRDVQGVVTLFLLGVLPPMIAGASLIVQVLFGLQRLDVAQADIMVDLIRAYLLALVPVSLYLVHGSALLARQRGRIYAAWGVITQAMSIALLLALLPQLGIRAFPVALFVSHSIAAIAMAWAVGPSAAMWKDVAVSMLLLFGVTQTEQILFKWLQAHLHEPVVAMALGLAAHGAFVAVALAFKRSQVGGAT
jgi:peptidoglycan biosynthesis protein MviN/MurJ (putative lipid II flippase)